MNSPNASHTLPREIAAGLTTFLAMAYILFANPAILGDAGMDRRAAYTATVLTAGICSLMMGLIARLPYAIAPGMGINSFFAYGLVLGHGASWQVALGATLISGALFLTLSLTKARELIVAAIPNDLKAAIGAGIGLFIAVISLKKGGLIVAHPHTLVTLGDLSQPSVLFFIFGIAFAAILLPRLPSLALLLSILTTTLLAWALGFVHMPTMSGEISTAGIFAADISGALRWSMLAPIFTIVMTDLFDSVSSLVGIAKIAQLEESDGRPLRLKAALFVDALATSIAGLVGSSAGTVYIESAAGIRAGGRTGITAIVTGLCFFSCLWFGDLAAVVPDYATAPALLLVGLFMSSQLAHIDFSSIEKGFPAFLAVLLIPLTFSITHGVCFAYLAYVLISIAQGRYRELPLTAYSIAAALVVLLAIGS